MIRLFGFSVILKKGGNSVCLLCWIMCIVMFGRFGNMLVIGCLFLRGWLGVILSWVIYWWLLVLCRDCFIFVCFGSRCGRMVRI